MEDKKLYHGSRGGIQGEIKPISRERCDFGQGFYLGESPLQAKGLIAEDLNPVFYEMKFKLSEIPEDKILKLSGSDWMYAVIASRQYSKEFNKLEIAKKILGKMRQADVIIGPIADDRMNEAMRRFLDYSLTDAGLLACLQSVNYGAQYVAKTNFACSKIDILDHKILRGQELQRSREYTNTKRSESRNIIRDMSLKYQREGLYFNELIQRERNREMEWER